MDTTRDLLQEALGDGYEVGDLLGRGGFAEVFVAHEKRLKRDVAVKILRSDLVLSEQLVRRFQLEAEAVARVRHPNIIEIYSVGGSGGTAFLSCHWWQVRLSSSASAVSASCRTRRRCGSCVRRRAVSLPLTMRASSTATSSPPI